ncbi:MAG: ABC transporter substrate-binding protein, partial [Rhodospirillaceae bacterium]
TDVPLTYVTREVQGAWRIIDVLVDAGISELAVRRSEYRLILKTDGIDGLITVLGDKASALRSGG